MRKERPQQTWGHCSHCRFFGSPARAPLDGEQASCNEPALAKLALRVVGTCGCNRFELRPGLARTLEEPRA
jgi:hypothetical protein